VFVYGLARCSSEQNHVCSGVHRAETKFTLRVSRTSQNFLFLGNMSTFSVHSALKGQSLSLYYITVTYFGEGVHIRETSGGTSVGVLVEGRNKLQLGGTRETTENHTRASKPPEVGQALTAND
jgi:hypothetical protein